FVFQDLNQPAGVTAGQTYFVKQVLSPTSFTFAQSPSGGAVTGASAGGGDLSALATVRRVTNRAGGAVFNPPPGTYRVTLVRREPGFQAVPIAEDGQVAATTGDLSEWVTVSNSSDQQTVQFQYERLGLIEGRVFSDLDGDRQLQSQDPGLAGVQVYLD